MNERKRKINSVLASSLKSNGKKGIEAELAMAKLNIAKRNYDKAEVSLLALIGEKPSDRVKEQEEKEKETNKKTSKTKPSEKNKKASNDKKTATNKESKTVMVEVKKIQPDVRQALYTLYSTWGRALMSEEDKKYEAIVDKYEQALRFVDKYDAEKLLKEDMMVVLETHAESLKKQGNIAEAIPYYKKSLKYKYLPNTLVEIANGYDRLGDLDEAIVWYREAFKANPSVISIRLTNALIKKARQLQDDKKMVEAKKYFDEADNISREANLPLDVLYPVKVSEVEIISSLDDYTGEMQPVVKIKFENQSDRDLSFLVAKVSFMTGSKNLGEVTQVVVTPEKLLGKKGSKKDKIKASVKASEPLNVHMLEKGILRVKVSIAYNEMDGQDWKVKAMQEAALYRPKPDYEDDPERAPEPFLPLPPSNQAPLPGNPNSSPGAPLVPPA